MENTNSVSFLKSTTTRRLRPDEIKFTQLAFDREQTVGFRLENVFSAGEILGMPLSSADVVLFTARYDMYGENGVPSLIVGILFDQNFLGTMEYTPEEFELVLDLISRGQLDVKRAISGVIGLDEVPATFTHLLERKSNEIKILIDPFKE